MTKARAIDVAQKAIDYIKANELIDGFIEELSHEEDIIFFGIWIEPTRSERKEWKQRLYDTLDTISDYHDELRPRKKDSLETLLEAFFCWAEDYNDGYLGFSEEEAKDDRFLKWLLQEWKKVKNFY